MNNSHNTLLLFGFYWIGNLFHINTHLLVLFLLGRHQQHSRGARRGEPPRAEIRRGGKNTTAKVGVIRGHQESHDFWEQQNCSPPQAPITHAMPSLTQGDHFPDHMKFPDFSSRGKQRLPGIECLPISSTVVVSY